MADRPPAWRREIEELHDFFEGWFRGGLPETDEVFERVAGVLHEELVFVPPSGRRIRRAELLAGLRSGHGSRPALEIRIERAELHLERAELLVATYEEWQREEGSATARLSTVVFAPDPAAPNGLSWLHVHESWIEGRGAPGESAPG